MPTGIENYKDEFEYFDASLGEEELTVLSVQLEACFLFWDGHTEAVRQQLKSCIKAYMAVFGDHVTWGFEPKSWRAKPIDKLPRFQQHLDNHAHIDDCIEWFVASGSPDALNESFDYSVFCLTARGWQVQDTSQLRFRIQRENLYDPVMRKAIIQLFNHCIDCLNPYRATMGWGSAFGYDKGRVGIDILDQAHCFLGINIYDVWDKGQLRQGIRSIDWWTYISDELAERVGGMVVFKAQVLAKKVVNQPYDKGILLIAADEPQLLPSDGRIPTDYININTLTRPMRNGNYGSIGNGYDMGVGNQSFNSYFTDLWIRRFDHPKLWRQLPQPIDNQTRSQPNIDIVTLKTGDVGQISGRYRYENEYDHVRGNPVHVEDPYSTINDYRQYVVLLKGDIAPYYIQMDQHGHMEKNVSIAWTLFEIL
ncbi:type VI immunity family protein [Psychrobacter aestuarii]|uniref:DUF3396 domain-containing protein n=1 Tax=Psychrobacter aestuarii TaxID=556327 RepID=A0ABN0VKV5_9GAMM|nr:type VI immunity family protein [Psychrobacter aestuarii]